MALLVYVDDIVIAANNAEACDKFKAYLNACFNMKDLEPLKYFLGIEAVSYTHLTLPTKRIV